MKPVVADALSRFVTWTRKDALPLWVERGLHVPGGWFSTRLARAGVPVIGEVIDLTSQAQMIYVICRAEQRGWLGGRRKLVHSIIDFAGRHGTLPCRSDGYVCSLDESFAVLDSSYDPANHAWFVVANTACFSSFGDTSDLRRVYNILDWLTLHFADGAGWLDTDRKTPGSAELHRLMLQAFLYLAEVTHKPVWHQRAKDLLAYCVARFIAPAGVDGARSLAGYDLAERLAWVLVLRRCDSHLGTGLVEATELYRDAVVDLAPHEGISGAPTTPLNAGVMAQAVAAGLELYAAGLNEVEPSLELHLARLVGKFFVNEIPGLFVDEPEQDQAAGSVATLVSLFEAAVLADDLLGKN